MGKPTGFLEWTRQGPDKRPASARLRDFREIPLPLAPDHAKQQAGRCMDCGVPFCQQGCPLGNAVPDFQDHVWHGRWKEAFFALAATNDFPEWTGRICPAPCEGACVLAIDGAPVQIEAIEQALADRAAAEGWSAPRPALHRSGKRVAIVGSGPAGLSAARRLLQAGHDVTVFERADRPGGLLRYGIPDFKLEKRVLDASLARLQGEGLRLELNVEVGVAPTWAALRGAHDAILLALGARRPRELAVPGRELSGVVQAMDYLEEGNRAVGEARASRHDLAGQRVIVLGGGDTGSDCLGTALRQGAASVTQLELLPAPPVARASGNPWPQWPGLFRTSTSQEEGGARLFARRTTGLVGRDGKLCGLSFIEVEPDGASGLRDRPGTQGELPCDALLLALGFLGPRTDGLAELGVALDPRGNVQVDAQFCSTVPGIYAAGDATRGASLVVWALSDGREAARAIDVFLTGRPSAVPTRGQDRPFGGR